MQPLAKGLDEQLRPAAGRDAEYLPEMSGEVALVGEAGLECGVGQIAASGCQGRARLSRRIAR